MAAPHYSINILRPRIKAIISYGTPPANNEAAHWERNSLQSIEKRRYDFLPRYDSWKKNPKTVNSQ